MADQNAYVIHGNDVLYGLANANVPWGIVLNDNGDKTKNYTEYPGQNGETQTVVSNKRKREVKLEILRGAKNAVDKAADLPMPDNDDIVEYEGHRYIVTNVSEAKPIDDAWKVTVTLTHYPFVTLPDANEGNP